MDQPQFKGKLINTLDQLIVDLAIDGLQKQDLEHIGQNAATYYIPNKPQLKSDGKSIRQTYSVKNPLKKIQKAIYRVFFCPPAMEYPTYLHGSIRGRDAQSNALLHLGAKTCISADAKDFFNSVRSEYVHQVFSTICRCATPVAELLTLLTCHDGKLPDTHHQHGHLPQGGSTSAALANLVLFESEPELVQMLRSENFTYSRYVDDITVSACFRLSDKQVNFITSYVVNMLHQADIEINWNKYDVAYRGSKPIEVTGINVGDRLTKPKDTIRKVGAAVHQVMKKAETCNRATLEYCKMWESANGRVQEILRYQPRKSAPKRWRKNLNSVRPAIECEKVRRRYCAEADTAVSRAISFAEEFGYSSPEYFALWEDANEKVQSVLLYYPEITGVKRLQYILNNSLPETETFYNR